MQNSIYAMFENKLNENKKALAVYDEKRSLTREELDALADTIAAMLPANAKRVGIVMNHSVEMIAAIFAVLKIGAAYVPVEPFFPRSRIHYMMKNSDVTAVITNSKYASCFEGWQKIVVDEGLPITGVKVHSAASEESLAYILYTSGSTGAPKGVSVLNSNVCHYVRAFAQEFHPSEADTMLQYSVCSFDIFVEEVFATILNGAVLAIPAKEDKKDIHRLMAFVDKHHLTIMSGFPYLLLEMNHLDSIPSSLRLLISGGDVLRASYINHLIDKVTIYNTYGPSETTVCTSYFKCNGAQPLKDGTYPIGKAVLASKIIILDENLQPVQDGKVGEICILGDGVAAGYVDRRKIESKAFVQLEDGKTLYRSGDLGYVLPDGNIAFLHRKDTQVMILGKRVETAEVESTLFKCPGITKAVVKAFTDEQHLSYLVAYIVTKEPKVALSTLKKEMAKFLPTYMIPEFFVCLQDLPLNVNGKVDAKALPFVLKEGNCA
jgi:D-alanine--poly(phosphoribitol) ligase subunit 1